MKLAALQDQFRQWLVTGDEAGTEAFGASARPGLQVYQNNYRVQLMGCLEVSYPLLRRFIGEDAFREAAITHIDARPPRGWTLDHYGADFGETLRALHPRNPDLEELAWIEWMLGEAFVAADTLPATPEALASVDWDHANLVLSPSVRVRRAVTNADDVWMALRDGEAAVESEWLAAPEGLLVWRRDHMARLRRTDAVESAALVALGKDPGFGSLCETLVGLLGEEAGVQRAGQLLADWLSAGVVVGITDA
ncbi:HvfC/BufC family peptide modification chaperone [Luteibacter sp.]|uniref:HvfC/BufC family peptide modification chaperone n=1 Tax=Luteibacter sp. TaxID=1886636 RepID=UPI003F7D9DEF